MLIDAYLLNWIPPAPPADAYHVYEYVDGEWQLYKFTTQTEIIVSDGCYRVATLEASVPFQESSPSNHICTEGTCHAN